MEVLDDMDKMNDMDKVEKVRDWITQPGRARAVSRGLQSLWAVIVLLMFAVWMTGCAAVHDNGATVEAEGWTLDYLNSGPPEYEFRSVRLIAPAGTELPPLDAYFGETDDGRSHVTVYSLD